MEGHQDIVLGSLCSGISVQTHSTTPPLELSGWHVKTLPSGKVTLRTEGAQAVRKASSMSLILYYTPLVVRRSPVGCRKVPTFLKQPCKATPGSRGLAGPHRRCHLLIPIYY